MRGAVTRIFGLLLLVATLGLGNTQLAMAQLGGGLPGPSQSLGAPAPALAPAPGMAAAPMNMGTAITDDSYVLGTGDKVRLSVYREDDLGGDFAIDGTGILQLPLVGPIKAAGLSLHQVHDAIVEKLSDGYLKDPRVSLQVLNYRPFYILGEVNKPGEYPYENGMSVLTAVALAGGYTYRANDSKVYVRSQGQTTEREVKPESGERIQPGDVIRVKERFF
jgi:polysaccharide export outer membrane protein